MRKEKRKTGERRKKRSRWLSSRIPNKMVEIMLPNLGRIWWDNSSTNKT